MFLEHSSALLEHSSALPASLAFLVLPAYTSALGAYGLLFLCALVAAGFVWLRQKFQTIHLQINGSDRNTAQLAALAAELEAQALLVRQLSSDLEELRKRVDEQNGPNPASLPFWSSAETPVNLNRRGQIIRLSRKGKSIPEIAQDLNVAQGEVELLLKVHDLSQKKFGQG
jgi:hypothetical protein